MLRKVTCFLRRNQRKKIVRTIIIPIFYKSYSAQVHVLYAISKKGIFSITQKNLCTSCLGSLQFTEVLIF